MQFISLALRDERLDSELCSTMIVLAQFRLDVCFPGVSQTPSSQAHTSWMTFCCLPLGSLHGSALRLLPSSQPPLLTPTLAPFSVSQTSHARSCIRDLLLPVPGTFLPRISEASAFFLLMSLQKAHLFRCSPSDLIEIAHALNSHPNDATSSSLSQRWHCSMMTLCVFVDLFIFLPLSSRM